jgi:SagB-type dehydrogenase family enzyme
MIVFITAIFERSVFKYGNRGYRFVLLEAGHVAQNLNLATTALGLSCCNIGGFFDRDVDRFLGLDGIGHSTVYLVGIGGAADGSPHE